MHVVRCIQHAVRAVGLLAPEGLGSAGNSHVDGRPCGPCHEVGHTTAEVRQIYHMDILD